LPIIYYRYFIYCCNEKKKVECNIAEFVKNLYIKGCEFLREAKD